MALHPSAPSPAPPPVGVSARPQPAPPVPPKTPQEEEQLFSKWKEFLARPEVKAGMLQFAINAMQPVAPGQTRAGHLAGAVSGGGQAIGRVRTSRREREEAKRKAGLEERRVSVEEEGLTVRREEITSRERIAEERGFTLEDIAEDDRVARGQIASEGLEAYSARLNLELSTREDIAQNQQSRSLLTTIIKDGSKRYADCIAASTPGDVKCKPPTSTSVMSEFNFFNSAIKNKGVVPDDGTLKDEPYIEVLVKGTEADKARVRARMEFMSETQRDRIEAKASGSTVSDLPFDEETPPPVEPTPPRQRREPQESQRLRRERERRERQAIADKKAKKPIRRRTRAERRPTGRLPQ